MPVPATCPKCHTSFNMSDQQRGKKVRCNHCYAVFVVPAAAPPAPPPAPPVPARTVQAVKAAAQPNPRPRPATVSARPSAPPRARRDDEPRVVRAKKKSVLPWVLGCGGAAAVFLVLVVGGVITAVVMLREKPKPVASNTAPDVTQPQPPPRIEPQPFRQPLNNPPPPKAEPVAVRPADSGPNPGRPVLAPATPPVEVQPPPRDVRPPADPVKPPADPVKPPADPVKPREPEPPADTVKIAPPPDEPRRPANNGRIGRDESQRVKRATVYLRVTMPNGGRASGTGFFGCAEAPNIILTNAHVVGMLAPESRRPTAVEVVVNSGEADEWKTSARVLGVDRSSDLAVLDIGTPTGRVPKPLTVKTATELRELDEVYVFGFPFGEKLGKEITIRPASVSSLRKKGGVLDRVQVNGGMDPGNSGGPVVDNTGAVVGVAVSGIPGRQINFAIPGDRVHIILNGRISTITRYQPYFTADKKVAVPVMVEMIDPRNLIKEVGLDVWAGDKPAGAQAGRRAAKTQPPALPGDSPHVYYKLKYEAPQARDEIVLPDLSPDKVYWQQPRWVDAKGVTHWASANPMKLPSEPVERKPANLVLRLPQGAARDLDLTIDNTLKVSADEEDSDSFRMRTAVGFKETVRATGTAGSTLTLNYRAAKRELMLPGGKTRPSSLLEQIKNELPLLVTQVQLDPLGNITRQTTNENQLLGAAGRGPRRGRLPPQMQQVVQKVQMLKDFHEVIQQGMEAMTVSMPPQGMVNPQDRWKAERHLPIDTPGKFESGKLDVTFTYQGVRTRNGREEAVLDFSGVVQGKDASVGGKATGRALVDLATGQTLLAETTVTLDLEAVVSEPGEAPRKLRVLAIVKVRLQRKL